MRCSNLHVLSSALLVAGCSLADPYAAEVFIENIDTASLTTVELVVTGASYTLSDIPPGETRSIKVYPTGESGLMLWLTDASGQQTELMVPVYFEPSYRDRLDLTLTQTEIVAVEHDALGY